VVRGSSVLITRASPVCVYVPDFAEQCNEKEAKEEETNFVKQGGWFFRLGCIPTSHNTLRKRGHPDPHLGKIV